MSYTEHLAHYGVKGMKWGVRKDQYRDYKEIATTSSSGSGSLKAKVGMSIYTARAARIKAKTSFDENWYNNLDTGKRYLEQGKTLNRVVRGVDKNALNGRLYVSHLKSDGEMYKGTIPAVQKRMAYGQKQYHSVYQVQMETKKKLAMPSAKERVDTFIDVLQTTDGRQWLKDNGYKGEIDELNAKEVGLKYYQKFNKYAGDQSSKLNDTYFNAIKSKGYSALLDDNDAGVWSKEPIILLSPKNTVKIKSVRQLTADEINAAQKNANQYRFKETE